MATTLPSTGAIIPEMTEAPDQAVNNAAFTAIDAAIASHLAESASKHIADSGSNSNGYYVKFDDGTQICWHTLDLGTLTIASNQVSPAFLLTFPATFTAVPVININNQADNADWMRVSFSTVSTTSVAGIVIFNYFSSPLTQNHKIHLFAIGRWK